VYCFFFFFQAEDGIRDRTVTGVQTCALPILFGDRSCYYPRELRADLKNPHLVPRHISDFDLMLLGVSRDARRGRKRVFVFLLARSEERRVGKECRARGGMCQ